LNPQFTKVFVFDYELGTPMRLAVSIFDEVSKGQNKSMGCALFDVGEILGARGQTKAKRVSGGTIFAHVRKSEGTGMLRLKLKGVKLKSTEGMGLLRKSDPFFELSRQINSAGGDTWDNVFRSDHIKNNLNPEWEDVAIELSTLCGGDLDLPIQISIFDHESSGKHVLMGKFETTVHALTKADTEGREDMGMAIPVTVKGKVTGNILVLKAQVAGASTGSASTEKSVTESMASVYVSSPPSSASNQPTFLDYVSGGCGLNVIVAIDFTGSNGDPRKPGTLHHLDSASKNDYEKAISAIVGILAKYDSDKMFPVVGFGAKYDGTVRHCFQCGSTEEVHGVAGVLEAYHQTFKSGLIMSSPTVFTAVIESAAARALSSQDKAKQKGQQAYTILLIVTDGAVADSQATAASLQQVSDAPLSVVIVGVGDADFSSMEFLDDSSKPGQRDIAQFVQMNKHQTSSADLSSVTLREIPQQYVLS
jgi:hypothetical protein